MTLSSTELLEKANTEWCNREERRHIHERAAWTSGWISGYLTSQSDSITEGRRQALNDALVLFDNGNYNGQEVRRMLLRLRDGK